MKLVLPSVLCPDCLVEDGFGRQPLLEPCARRRLQLANHRGDDPAFLDEVHLLLEYLRVIVIKSDNEATLHFQAGALQGLDVGDHVAVAVLPLAALREARGSGDSMPTKTVSKPASTMARVSFGSSARLMETACIAAGGRATSAR